MVRTTPPQPPAKPAYVEPATQAHPEIPSEELALQVAIACEQSTVDGLRRRLGDVLLVPQVLGSRTCQRVLTGHFLLREDALAAAAAVQKRAGTDDPPLVVVRPADPSPR